MRARVIVLKIIKHSESDLFVHTLNSEGDRLHFLARGALKSKKRFGGGVLEPTHYLDVLYKEGRSTDAEPLHFLQEAKVIRDFQGVRSNYERLSLALYLVGLVHQLTRTGAVGAKEIFDLLGHALSSCESVEHTENLKLQFQAKLLYSQGVLDLVEEFAPLIRHSLKQADELSLALPLRQSLQKHMDLATEEMLHP
jgi:DNA repair protein RecO (recombination protein O)